MTPNTPVYAAAALALFLCLGTAMADDAGGKLKP
jgi:hypothetical protein